MVDLNANEAFSFLRTPPAPPTPGYVHTHSMSHIFSTHCLDVGEVMGKEGRLEGEYIWVQERQVLLRPKAGEADLVKVWDIPEAFE